MPATNQASKTAKPAKLTREQIRAGLDQVPIESLLSSGKGKTPQLTHKQREFARAVAMGKTKAQAYRETYKVDATPATLAGEPYRLASDPRIATEIEAYQLAIEAEKHRTPAQLKALLVQQLVQHSLDAEFPPAQRVQCLRLLGSLFEVGAFVERKEITTVNKSEDIRARLLSVLGSHAVDVEAKPAASVDDSAASLLAELQATPSESSQPAPHPEGGPPFGPVAEGLYTHTIPDIQSKEIPDDFDKS
jgi:hypothetical protein